MANIEKRLKALANIEKRLKALEKRAQTNDEVWQTLDGHIRAFSLIIDAIGAPICATIPSIGNTIITNLRNFENAGKNNNDVTIRQLGMLANFSRRRSRKAEKAIRCPKPTLRLLEGDDAGRFEFIFYLLPTVRPRPLCVKSRQTISRQNPTMSAIVRKRINAGAVRLSAKCQ